ncbi:MAG TPA: outer membrane beta-barrel protein [Bacteroidales bacterium]|nr:outer membrane beta-barrel protein [Bacteroidales bacterium]
MLRKTIILSFILSVCILNGYSQQEISVQQRYDIEANVNEFLNSFEKYLNLESSTENDMNNLAELEKLFGKDARASNFLDPVQSKSVQIPAKTFADYIRLNYTSGLSTSLSWDIQKLIVSETQDMQLHSVYLPVGITALGIHRSQKIVNISESYYFVFHFKVSDSGISGFRLSSIQQSRPLKIRKSNNYMGFCATPLYSIIYSKNIFSSSDWDANGRFGYHFSLHFNHKLNNHFSLSTGIGFSKYQSEYRLTDFNNENINTIERVDKDDDEYFAYYTGTNIDEWNCLSFIDIPIGVNYRSTEKGLGIAVQAGFNLSFMVSSFFEADGNATIKGYYPEYRVILYDIPEYGFTENPVDTTSDWNLNQFNLSAFVSLGVQIPAGDKFTIYVGPYFAAGLTDLVYNKVKHRDDFLSISGDPGKLTTRGIGLRFELLMKL